MHEVNIAVINITDIGQTSFLDQVFDLPGGAGYSPKPNIYTLHGVRYAISFNTLPVQDLRYAGDGQIRWPKWRGATSKVHAAALVYDVSKPNGLAPVSKILGRSIDKYCS